MQRLCLLCKNPENRFASKLREKVTGCNILYIINANPEGAREDKAFKLKLEHKRLKARRSATWFLHLRARRALSRRIGSQEETFTSEKKKKRSTNHKPIPLLPHLCTKAALRHWSKVCLVLIPLMFLFFCWYLGQKSDFPSTHPSILDAISLCACLLTFPAWASVTWRRCQKSCSRAALLH